MHYKIQLFVTILICIYFISISDIFKNVSYSAKALFAWICFSGFAVLSLPLYQNMGFVSNVNLKIIAGNSLFYFIFLTIFVFSLSVKNFKIMIKIMGYACIFSSTSVIARHLYGLTPWGIGLNSSTEGTYLAIMMPFVFFSNNIKIINKYYIIKIIPVIAIFITTSSVGIFGMIFSFIVYFAIKNKKILPLILPTLICVGASYFFIGKNFFSSSTRVGQWILSFNWWKQHANPYLGTGVGTYFGFGPLIQSINKYELKGGYFVNAHNDWLQIGFELGLIGLILSVVLFIDLLKKSKNSPWLFASIATYAFVSGMNMPLRYPITALAGLMMARIAYGGKDAVSDIN